MTTNEPVFLSLVVPAYNEEAVIGHFYDRTGPILKAISENFEIIFINDGSRDRTVDEVVALHERDPRVKLIDLSRNFGKEIALSAGLDFSRGEVVIVIDADLQDPPELIPQMVAKWREGYDMVYATRLARQGETLVKKATANAFYRMIGRLTKIHIPKNTGDFRLLSRRAVEALKTLREQHRFMKGLFSWIGFRQISLPYCREPRYAGQTKWNYWKLWNFAIEGITSFSYIPLQVASYIGLTIASCSFVYAFYLVLKTFYGGVDVPGYASLMVAILFFSGVQLSFLGVMGEYLGRMFNETKNRPLYLAQG
ncbi:MAG: glycosyltransferase family 2 protein, partial [Desulfuromonadales bacterium]|nr:glycosyltransferase family 2 protein [Desulfuromonadales bacterium]